MATKEELNRLFGSEAKHAAADALIFEEPDAKLWQSASVDINNGITKNQAWAMAQALQPLLRSRGAVLLRMKNGKLRPAIELQALFSMNNNKLDMTRALALILCLPANLQLYIDRLNAHQRELWLLLLGQIYVSEHDALRILHTDVLFVKEQRRSYYYYDATDRFDPPELMFFTSERSISATISRYGYRQRETFITLPPTIHAFFLHALRPETQVSDWFCCSEPPADNHVLLNFESDSVAKYPLLQGLLQAGKIGMTQKGVSLSNVKTSTRSLGLPEIFGSNAVKGSVQEVLRARYYVEPLTIDYHYIHLHNNPKEPLHYALRRLFHDNFTRLSFYLMPLLLPHIKGLRRQFTEDNTLSPLLTSLVALLSNHPDRWISIADALQQLLTHYQPEDNVAFDALVFSPSNMSDIYDMTNDYSKQIIAADRFVAEFGLTVCQAFCLMLCSLGMAEVTLSPLHRPESPFARAEHVRLTDLGRYAFGLTKVYEPPHIDQQAYFELDPDRLIIRSLATPNPYEQLLRDSSVPISKNRFETSPRSFLAHCKSREDVEKNIAIFRQFISSDLPPLWTQFFDTLLQRCHPLTRETTAYHIFRLQPDDSQLISLITTDDRLRRLVVRAEGFCILVKVSNLSKFEERLKQHGYLL